MLPADQIPSCPQCETPVPVSRRDFIRVVGTTAAVAAVGLTPLQKAQAARAEKQAQAEAMVFDLFKSLSDDQKKKITRPWDHKPTGTDKVTSRLATGNAAVTGLKIGNEYNKKQLELLDKIFRAIGNGDEGYKQLSRNGRFDNSNDFENISAIFYGDAVEGKKFSLVFTGHHLTVRCDGNSEEKTAFGGPLYYGHSPLGTAKTNVFYPQTQAGQAVFESLSKEQRESGLVKGNWKDEHGGVKVPGKGSSVPGVLFADMKKEQKELVEKLMKALVAPYRKEDGDEVMEIIKANGGMEKIALAFYNDPNVKEKADWHYWRLEGPGFVWSFRSLEHVHTFVNITSKLA
jgi:hypothetical protein